VHRVSESLMCSTAWYRVYIRTHTLQHTRFNTLQHTAAHCSTLQHTAAHCNTLQHTATHCNSMASHVYSHFLRTCALILKSYAQIRFDCASLCSSVSRVHLRLRRRRACRVSDIDLYFRLCTVSLCACTTDVCVECQKMMCILDCAGLNSKKNPLQHTATHYSRLQLTHTATHCNPLQQTATRTIENTHHFPTPYTHVGGAGAMCGILFRIRTASFAPAPQTCV